MSRYAADSLDRVLDAVDMVALVSERVELVRRGVDSYFGRCPFHEERTASFHVTPDKKLYYCFGCQASGNAIRWVQETEGVDFKGALESLARRSGVQLEMADEDPEAAARRSRRERLHGLLGRAAGYYARYLWEAGEAASAREYLLGRGLAEDMLREFRVGYAPSAWDRILVASRQAGFSEDELVAVGLAQRSSGGRVFDRFRERIMFPAVDARGRVQGFGARKMREDAFGPKYLNTSDGELYHKREVLFGIDLARAAAARAGRMILVEGYTDVIALHQAGMRNCVGIMGTSLTEEQIGELTRVVKVLELCLDADAAGQDAVVRAARVAAGRSVELRVVVLPEGLDPADLVAAEGAEAVQARVQASVPFVEFNVRRILERADLRSAEGRDQALTEVGPLLRDLRPGLVRDDLVRLVAGRLELQESQLARSLSEGGTGGAGRIRFGAGTEAREPAGAARPNGGAGPSRPAETDPVIKRQRQFLALCLALPQAGERMLAEVDVDELLTSRRLREAARHLAGHLREPLADLPPDDDDLARLVGELVNLAGRIPDPSPDRLQHTRMLLELDRLERAIIRARAEGSGVGQLARERETVRAGIREVVARLERTL